MNPTVDTLFQGCTRPPQGLIVIEPFTGNGEILKWIGTDNIVIPYDSEPKVPKVIRRNVLIDKPKYFGTYVVTRPPQLHKSESQDKTVFEQYGTDNLYKCFIKTLLFDQPAGGIIIIPIGFLSGLRDSEQKRRLEFFKSFKPNRINVFDMETLVIDFYKRPYVEPFIKESWSVHFYPENTMSLIEVENKPREIPSELSIPLNKSIPCRFTTQITDDWYNTKLVLQSSDAGRPMGLYFANDSTESHLQLWGVLSKKVHARLCQDFNEYISNMQAQKPNILVPFTYIGVGSAIKIIQYLIWSYSLPI